MSSHIADTPPSPWVRRFAPQLPAGGTLLDIAAGQGRHARLLAAAGLAVVAVDRDPDALAALRGIAGVTVVEADLESAPWPFGDRLFDVIVVTNYLWRPLMDRLARSLAPGGWLIYETFRLGNEKFGKPSNPAFLLREGELLEFARAAGLAVAAFESGTIELPRPAVVERLCARRALPGMQPSALAPAGHA
jgi:SAM-dependent methyltransferase